MRRIVPESPSQTRAAEAVQRRAVLEAADTLLAVIDELLAEPAASPVHR